MEEIKETSYFNNSGFNDDSIFSDEIKSKTKSLIKSKMTDSTNNIIKNTTSNSINEKQKAKSSKHLDELNNNIITTNTAENIKNSINSEDEYNIFVKNENKEIHILIRKWNLIN